MSNWNHVSSKLGNIQPATRSIAKEIYDAARAAGHEIWFMWGIGASGEHGTGRALDLMVRNKAAGDWINAYVWRHRKRLRLQHVIWWQRITSTTNQPGVARLMADRGNSTQNHKDHPHILVNPGAYRAPSGGTTNPQEEDMPTAKEVANYVWNAFEFNAFNTGKEYGMPKESAGRRLRRVGDRAGRAMVLSRRNSADIAGLQAAVKALGKAQGIDEATVERAVREAAEAALADVSITLAVDSDEDGSEA